MPTTWFIVPFVTYVPHRTLSVLPAERELAILAQHAAILADGGTWREVELNNNRALVKVRASAATLVMLAAVYKRLPKDRLDDPLSSLGAAAKTALRAEMLDQGYTAQEITDRFGGDLGARTLGDVLRFMARRRRKPRFDNASQNVVCDGEEVGCFPTIDDIEREVT